MDTYNKEKKTYVINGNEYSEAVALSYMQTICGFTEQETKEYLELLVGAEHQAVVQKAL